MINVLNSKKNKHLKNVRNRGFTLIEVILALALLFLIAAITTPIIVNIYNRIENQTISEEIVSTMKMAQSFAFFNKDNSHYGVKFDNENKQFVFFRGNSYLPNDSFNQFNNLYGNTLTIDPVLADGIIIFEKITGQLLNLSLAPINDPVEITISQSSFVRKIYICDGGLIDFTECIYND